MLCCLNVLLTTYPSRDPVKSAEISFPAPSLTFFTNKTVKSEHINLESVYPALHNTAEPLLAIVLGRNTDKKLDFCYCFTSTSFAIALWLQLEAAGQVECYLSPGGKQANNM